MLGLGDCSELQQQVQYVGFGEDFQYDLVCVQCWVIVLYFWLFWGGIVVWIGIVEFVCVYVVEGMLLDYVVGGVLYLFVVGQCLVDVIVFVFLGYCCVCDLFVYLG